ncbi:MAG: hypothetical protein UU77_C0019G0002 [candidate division WWE3 bacterium GW2011_GWC1_41_7]|uniref:Antitoxin n=4 Tax=Katanobacteria TaxID=422282 RepID=A0A0G1A9C2_UNCKA|nr:MAG: hypothetical protein UU72_C0013G0012 [candidate division WWE3 bacterium GW2011_GWB1_41_6]KKS20694.1 MAG: hypothetical protein UU77_C0019G0002 [candidate division WWE3 bacterium GW2011_GWC1_41_7]KKS21933.1 MAG: hypothetical protein UU80_C0017G0034 [candidate division WWE3 bacterium GW2011_GWA1_41_8]OGC57398.1 MAG: hypothetical protein A2976_04245 [candidate division WWE3 bacterium RIFCSPLOWO2_01_FULL_41_9]
MAKTISASKAKNNFGYLLEEVYVKGKSITITKNNKPIARISPIYSYEQTDPTPSLSLTDSEYKKVIAGVKEFRETFKFSY